MVRLGSLLRRTPRETEQPDEAPARPANLGPPLIVLIPDVAGVSSFRMYGFHDTEAATRFITSLQRPQRERAHAFWALQDEPTAFLDGDDTTGEATVLIRASEGADLVYVVSFVDIASAQSFARFEVKRGMQLGLMLVYWANMVSVILTEDRVQLVPEFPPRIDKRRQQTNGRKAPSARPVTDEREVASTQADAEAEAEELERLKAEADEHRRIAAEAEELRRRLAEEGERQRVAAEAEEQRRLVAEAAEQRRLEAEAEERQRAGAEERQRAEAEEQRRAEAEEQRRAEARADEQAAQAEAAVVDEQRRLAADAEEQRRRATEAEERRRLQAEAEEQRRLEAEAEEQRRLAAEAEEQRRLQVEAEEQRRIEAEAEEQRRLAAEAEEQSRVEVEAEEQRRLEAEAEDKRRLAEQAEEWRRQAEAEEQLRRAEEERANLEAEAQERLRAAAEAQAERERAAEVEMQRLRLAMEEEQRRIDAKAAKGGDSGEPTFDREPQESIAAPQAFEPSGEIAGDPNAGQPNAIEELLKQEAQTQARIPSQFAREPADGVPSEDEDEVKIADEVSKILRRRRWEKKDSPFEGFNSPPGRF